MAKEEHRLRDIVSRNVASLPPSSGQDARARRSSQALQDALLALIERKPLDQITVREIAAEAGVHYATFFRHHPTKESLLDRLAADQIDRLVALTLPVFDEADGHAAVVALCIYVDEHRRLWTALLTGGAAAAMRAELLRISREVAADRGSGELWLPVELAVNCSVGLILETLAWWLGQSSSETSIEKVATMIERLLASLDRGIRFGKSAASTAID